MASAFQDLHSNVRRISDFVGIHLSEDMISKITHQCSFEGMAKNSDAFAISVYPTNPNFLRKGEVGDWRSYFSEELNREFDKQLLSKLNGTGLSFDFGG